MKIVLIGAGNVATHLGIALKEAGHPIIDVYSRTAASANALAKKLSSRACTDIKAIFHDADLYIVSLSDHAVKELLKSLPITGRVIAHTSGSLSIDVFKKKFKHYGVIYPLQTFTINRRVNISQVPFCIEWNDETAKRKIEIAAKSISEKIYHLDSAKRKQIHLAAVFANNFTNHLYSVAETLMKNSGLSFDLLRPLILETALKVQSDSPARLQTGPAKRGDAEIISEHLKMLNEKKEIRKIYKLLSESISELHGMKL